MRLIHVHNAAAHEGCFAVLRMPHPEMPLKHSTPQVEDLPESEEVGGTDMEPLIALRPERETEPVRPVDEILVLDDAPGHLALEAIEPSGNIRSRIVVPARFRLVGRATGGKVAVSERAEGFPKWLFLRVPIVESERPY